MYFFTLKRLRLRHALFEGGVSAELKRELFVRDDAVCALLYDPVRDAVVLLEQFRVGALHDAASPWLLELIAGIVEPGESVDQVAVREAQEEAGAVLEAIVPICTYHVSPGGSQERIHLLCARVDSEGLGGVHGLSEEGEDIRVLVVPRREAYDGVVCGRINNGPSIMALQWLELNHAALCRRWLTDNDARDTHVDV